jgi:hypothetical protein
VWTRGCHAWLPWGTSSKSTKKTLIVALWSLDTQGMQHLPLHQRLADLQQYVERAYKLATAQLYHLGHDPNDRPLALFKGGGATGGSGWSAGGVSFAARWAASSRNAARYLACSRPGGAQVLPVSHPRAGRGAPAGVVPARPRVR